ncbi:MAG: histidine phosphatase family protein [Pasteurellaceae bacterium]|nr:histidine phosphatase family protein [Pasteurellaceae bacterium]
MSRILLIRHVTPKVSNAVCDHLTAQQRIDEYNQTDDLCLEEIDFAAIAPMLSEVSHIYCSPLIRAKRTAEALFPTHQIQFDERLKEFNLRIFPLPFHCSFKRWLIISRLLWFVGINRTQCSPTAEKQRVLDFMQQHSLEHSAIVAHGFVLRTVQKQLEKQGYRQQSGYRKGCFTLSVMTR